MEHARALAEGVNAPLFLYNMPSLTKLQYEPETVAAAAEIPDARLEVLPAGHVPQLGNPDRVAELLEQFASGA